MDIMTLAAAKAYTDKQRIGYSENIISSVNGSITPGDYSIPGVLFDTDGSFERVSSEYLHVAGAVESVSVYIGNAVPTMQATKPVASMTDDGVFLIMADIFEETKLVAISFNSTFEEAFGAPAGTYLWRGGAMDEEGIREVVVIGIKGYFKETVHQIDEKYLPSGGEKVIDLTKYIATESYSFNNLILSAFSSGGGAMKFTDSSSFWADVNTDETIKLVLDISALYASATIEAVPSSIMKQNDTVINLHITNIIDIIDSGKYMRASILFEKFVDGSTKIVVHIETLDVQEQ